ncbi:thermonuclease family protein [Roseobacter weihaiensis]|uniref:thermonuclease family protein n=1 Tax=Roseobacter weihaiensis TaxID=2763262 RepID=UPI001D0A6479|nr:thermonuclease family protein [Roseobacter sp. H9]
MIPALLVATFLAAPDPIVVVDGDTIKTREHGRMRIEGIDAPEMRHRADCLPELLLAEKSKARLESLLSGGVVVEFTGRRDGWNRPLVRLRLPDGRLAGQVLISEGLAITWSGSPGEWCDS